jgi:hypothetical protein
LFFGDSDDDWADRFNARSAKIWCQHGALFYTIQSDALPTVTAFVVFSGDDYPRLVGLGAPE